MNLTANLTDDQEKQIERVMKILARAERGGTPEEAATAAAMAQQLMEQYNLDMATVERRVAGETGKRESAAVAGGQYQYQRDLWKAVAELNFCMYFPGERTAVRSRTRRLSDGTRVEAPRHYTQKYHRIVGRVLNTTQTRNMSQYLEGAVERLCRERYPEQSQFFSSAAVNYRKGIAANITRRLYDRRQKIKEDEAKKKREAEARAASAGIAADTAVTLSSYVEDEKKSNFDHEYGEGAWDKAMARRKRNAEYWAKVEREQAEYDAAHPEEVAAREKKERAKARARDRAAERRREMGIPERGTYRSYKNYAADQSYYAGYRRGEEIGLEPQAEHGAPRSRRIAAG